MRILDLLFGQEVGGAGVMMTTLYADTPNKISRRAVLLGVSRTFVMSDHLISSPNLLLDLTNSTLGFRKAFGETRNWVGEAFCGDCFTDTTNIISTP